jgi:hypothetical protein
MLCEHHNIHFILHQILQYPFLCPNFLFSVALQPSLGLGRLFTMFLNHKQLDTNTHTHTHSVGLLLKSDRPLAGAAPYITRNIKKRRKFKLSARFEPAIPEAADLRLRPHGLRNQRPSLGYSRLALTIFLVITTDPM